MILIRWKDAIINVDGLRDTYYEHTQHRVILRFSTDEKVVCPVSSNKELEELYNRISTAVGKKER